MSGECLPGCGNGLFFVTIPNFITIGRLLSVPAIVYFIIADQFAAAALIFLAAGLSDGVDGFIAKHFDMRSELGAYLDPLADKALLMSVFIALTVKGLLPVWLTVLVVSRDILIVGAVMLSWIIGKPVAMAPLMISKANTTAQIGLAGLALAEVTLDFNLGYGAHLIIVLTGALTVLSALAYIAAWVRHMSNPTNDHG